jgi:hypothetical protein
MGVSMPGSFCFKIKCQKKKKKEGQWSLTKLQMKICSMMPGGFVTEQNLLEFQYQGWVDTLNPQYGTGSMLDCHTG